MGKNILERLEKIVLLIDQKIIEDKNTIDKFEKNILEILPDLKEYSEIEPVIYMNNDSILRETIKRIGLCPKDIYLRLSILFSDLGIKGEEKLDVEIESYLWKISRRSEDISKNILRKIGYKEDVVIYISKIILFRNLKINDIEVVRNIRKEFGEKILKDILRLVENDILTMRDSIIAFKRVQKKILEDELNRIKEDQLEIRTKDLDISIKDLEGIGLNTTKDLEKVMMNLLDITKCDNELNDRSILMGLARNL